MENTPITQHKIYVENSKSGEKTTAVIKRQPEKNIHYVKNFSNHIFRNNFLSSKP